MNKTVQSILSLTAFSALLIVITLFCGGLGFGRLFEIYGIMEYCFLGLLLIIDVLLIYKVYKLYAMQPKAIVLLLGLECCSILLWIAFICIDQSLLDWQITNFILQAVNLDGFEGDERGLNMLAVLCGIVYPLIGIGCLFTGLGFINKLVTTKDSILDGFEGDERGLNMLAVLCGIVYPLIGIGCLFTGLGFINKLVTTKDSI